MGTEDENVSIHKETLIHNTNLDVTSKVGVKRSRPWSDEKEPTVHVTYKHLTRASKQKLESVLQQWSEWEAENTSLPQSEHDGDRAGPVSHGASFQIHGAGNGQQSYRSSIMPQNSSQYSEAQNLSENAREARHRWTAAEDIVLISAWLNRLEQKAAAFWERIATYYAASEAIVGKPKRGPSQCKQRWKKINESVNKFVGCYSQASTRRSSGQSDDDVLKMAYELYFNDQKVKFALEHAWLELRHDQKWATSKPKESCKRTKLDEGGTYSSSSNKRSQGEQEECPRPPGVKSSKGKAKKSGTSSSTEASSLLKFEGLWEIKQKDTAARLLLSKQKLLDSLLGKAHLCEDEMELKKKLIKEMLG